MLLNQLRIPTIFLLSLSFFLPMHLGKVRDHSVLDEPYTKIDVGDLKLFVQGFLLGVTKQQKLLDSIALDKCQFNDTQRLSKTLLSAVQSFDKETF